MELAFGARPSMEVAYEDNPHSDKYARSIREIKQAYKLSFEKLKGIHVETIEHFEEITPEAYCLTYSNGTTISVDFGKKNRWRN